MFLMTIKTPCRPSCCSLSILYKIVEPIIISYDIKKIISGKVDSLWHMYFLQYQQPDIRGRVMLNRLD